MYSAMKKNCANIANVTMKRDEVGARATCASGRRLKSIIGALTRRSIWTNAAERDDRDREQPDDPRRAPVPAVALDERQHERRQADRERRDARRSRRSCRPSRRATSRVANSVTATATTAIGGLMKKIARQLTCSVRKPPTHGPDRERQRADPGPRADRHAALLGRERLRDDRQRRRHHERGADALDGPEGDERGVVRREADRQARERRTRSTPNRKHPRRPKMSPSRPPVTISTAKVSV